MIYLAVGLGGFLGSISRILLVNLITGVVSSSLPWWTLTVNLTGSLILAFFLKITLHHFQISHTIKTGIGTGFLGSYTTFSTFSVENITLINQGMMWLSLGYIAATSVGCVVFAWWGSALSGGVVKYFKPDPDKNFPEQRKE